MGDPITSFANATKMNPVVLFQQADAGDPALVNTARDFRMLADAIFVTPGVSAAGAWSPESSMRVDQHTGGPHATLVTIKRGTIILPTYGAGTLPGKYVAQLTGDMDITLPSPPASGYLDHRIVAFALDKADHPTSGAQNVVNSPPGNAYGWAIQVIEGSSQGSTPPPPAGSLTLAIVRRTAGTGSIAQAAINDVRVVARSESINKGAQWDVVTSSRSWVKPFGAKSVWVRAVGGGGGGGGAKAHTSADNNYEGVGGGGGGGGYAEEWYDDVSLWGPTVTVTVGGGGAGGSSAGGQGATGGQTKFGTLLTCNGGVGGYGAVATNVGSYHGGGNGGVGSGGTVNIDGADGGTGQAIDVGSSSAQHVQSGRGGGSVLGNDGRSAYTAGAGPAGQKYGGGGSGAIARSTVGGAGGAGAAGVCIIVSYF